MDMNMGGDRNPVDSYGTSDVHGAILGAAGFFSLYRHCR